MKTFVAFLTLPVIFLFIFFAERSYVSGDFIAAYALVFGWFASFALWIQAISLLLTRKEAVVVPAAPRAYISKKQAA